MSPFVLLDELRREVQERCDAIVAAHREWPCRAGCDQCCKSLGRLPELSWAEWASVEAGLEALPDEVQRGIARRMDEMEGPPFVCPFLEEATGRCKVYEFRPLACRTFGYYVERDGGRYCGIISERVMQGELADVVWGNHEAMEVAANRLGKRAGLREWRELTGLIFFKRS